MLAMENSSKSPVRLYRNCTGQVWYVHWFPSWKVCFGPNSRAVQSWEVCELEFQFFQWKSYVSYGEFFKVPCATVHELYRSNLVCTLIPIVKGVFWSKQLSCTALGSMWTGIWFYRLWAFIYFAMENFSKWPVRPYTKCTDQVWYVHWFPSWKVKSGMYIDFHLKRCVLVQTAELYIPGKYLNWNLNFINDGPMLAMENFSKSPVRPYTSCTGQIWYVHWFPSVKVCFGPNSRAVYTAPVSIWTGIWILSMVGLC